MGLAVPDVVVDERDEQVRFCVMLEASSLVGGEYEYAAHG